MTEVPRSSPLADPQVIAGQVSLSEMEAASRSPRRFFTKRTVLLTAVAALIVVVAIARAPINWSDAWNRIQHANLFLYAGGLLAYYSSFVVRGWRWRVFLGNVGERRRARGLIAIIVTSFFVNCVVPAKMGDVYRAYLLRERQAVSATKALGTIIAERLTDLCVLMILLLGTGAITFGARVPNVLVPYVIAGTVLSCGGVGLILLMRTGRGHRILRLMPEAVFARYETFRVGTVHAFGRAPLIAGLTVLIWSLEGTRLGFVVWSLGYGGLLGPPQFMLISLVAALLTTVPFLPGGLGLVEGGMVLVLVTVGGVGRGPAVSIALLDRSISYGSLVLLGFLVFAVSHLHHFRASQQSPELTR